MSPERLPRDVIVDGYKTLACPWCGQDVGAAQVSLEALQLAHQEDKGLAFASRDGFDVPLDGALCADCPHCARPVLVAFQWFYSLGRVVRLLAARTKADAALLFGAPAGD
jgi:hypothetical protein